MVKEKKKTSEKTSEKSTEKVPTNASKVPETMKLTTERAIALDFATKIYKEFDKIIKSIILFGSSVTKVSTPDSDIDIIIIIDDVSVQWDQELVAWYREELGKIMKSNPYMKSLHINSVKLSTWWQDLSRGDPVVINILRYGEPLIDFGGFFTPLKILLQEGKIKPTPESIQTLLQRAPMHIARTRNALISAVDGLYWACVDSAHAALIAAKVMPPSPEHIPEIMRKAFVSRKMLKSKYVDHYEKIHRIAKDIIHGKNPQFRARDLDEWIATTDDFVEQMAILIDKLISRS